MLYLAHFNLTRPPFDLTPNRALFFPDHHDKVLNALSFSVGRGEGIVKVVGEVGTGKTMLCRLLLQSLEEEDHEVAFITAPRNDPLAIASNVCREFGLAVAPGEDPAQLLAPFLTKIHGQGRRAVLLIDEAQALDRRGLETVRLLSNFETDEAKLLTVILFGQPELDQILSRHEMRQLYQRITFSFQTRPFDRQTAIRYLQHRIDRSTDSPAPHRILADGALAKLARASRGIPRLLNVLADRALMAAYADGAREVGTRHVRQALAEGVPWPRPPSLVARLLGRAV